MIDEILINVGLRRTRIALVAAGRLIELLLPGDGERLVGRIYLGRVARVMPAMAAAFVDLGQGPAGFLPLREDQRLHEGQAVLVQVRKEPVGDKGPRLATDLSLPGHYLAFAPYGRDVAVSRRIADGAERARLLAIAKAFASEGEGGFVLRTAAAGAAAEDIAADARWLRSAWDDIRARAARTKAPACLHADADAVAAALRDHLDRGVRHILIDDVEALLRARDYAARVAPWALARIERHAGPQPLFDLHGLEGQIEAALEPVVPLPSGGSMTIQGAEALTAVDVDAGGLVASGRLEETALHTNVEAAAELARQLRLRDIGGLIVVDFIDMSVPGQAAELLRALQAVVAEDPAPIRIGRMSEFGLVEITRRRQREPLAMRLTDRCDCCGGTGRRLSAGTVAERVLRAAEREAAARPGQALRIVAAPEVVADLGGPDGALLARLAARLGTRVALGVDAGCPRERFEVGPA